MKKLFLGTVCIFVLIPIIAHSAFNDVALTSETTIISVGGVDLNISGTNSVIESLTVNENNFSFTMQSGSIFAASSTDRRVLNTDDTNTALISNLCTDTASSLAFSATEETTITIIPISTTATCSGLATAAGGGGGVINTGGSGSSSDEGMPSTPVAVITAPQPTPVQEETGTVDIVPSANIVPSTVVVSPVFTKLLKRGLENSDIKRLQQLLNSDPDTQVASSGAGSPGDETNYFGSLTERAVQKFQEKYGVASVGDHGYGYVGPKTRAKLGEVFSTF